jgi:hypothetical protein
MRLGRGELECEDSRSARVFKSFFEDEDGDDRELRQG